MNKKINNQGFTPLGTVAECRIRPKLPNFGKFLSKIFSPILLYCLKNFIKNFLEIVKIYARKNIRRQSPLNPTGSARSNLIGFTLIELLVSIFIIAMMSVLFMVNYHNTNKRSELGMIKQKLASDIRLAQNYSLGSKTYNGLNAPSGGWGAHFNLADPTHYIIFADKDGDYKYNDDATKDLAKEIKNLPTGITIDSLSPASPLDIVFFPPDPVTYVNVLPTVNAQIILRENFNNSTAAVSVNFFGLIDTE